MSKILIRMIHCVLVTCFLAAIPIGGATGAIPNSDNPDAYTEKQYRRDLLEYNKRTLSEAYKQVGERDPKWDALMIEYLDAQAVVFTNGNALDNDRVPGEASKERILELTAMCRDLGCTDPLVNYIYLINSKDADDRYLNFARKVYGGLLDSQYPVNRKLAIAKRMIELLEKRGLDDELKQVEEVWADLFCAAAEDPTLSLNEQLQLYRGHISQLRDVDWVDRWQNVRERIDVPDAPNPWLVGMVCGLYQLEYAWDARGSGFAYTVTEEGWRLFDERLRLAKQYLEKAWEVAPHYPDAPTKMITVSMGLRTGEERLWFERAVAAQFDFYSAYSSYRWSIRPRWGGSIQQLHAFGLECLETKRFDTRVPSIYFSALRDIAQDEGNYEYWENPGIYERLILYFDERKTAHGSGSPPQHWDSMKVALAWRVGRYQEAI